MISVPDALIAFVLTQAVHFGDFFVPKQIHSPGFHYWNSRPWPRGEVIVKFSDEVMARDRAAFFKACEEWTTGTKAFCREARESENTYLLVRSEENVGCWTALGFHRDPRYRVFNFDRACWDHYNLVLHEVGHVLGLLHEHQRSDRDEHIEILAENIRPGLEHAFTKNGPQDKLHGPYDVRSIMHYPIFAYSKNGKPVMRARPGRDQLPTANIPKLSAQDKESIKLIYGKSK